MIDPRNDLGYWIAWSIFSIGISELTQSEERMRRLYRRERQSAGANNGLKQQADQFVAKSRDLPSYSKLNRAEQLPDRSRRLATQDHSTAAVVTLPDVAKNRPGHMQLGR